MGSTTDRCRPRSRKAGRLAALACCAVVLQSCFTNALWGFEPDPRGGYAESTFELPTDELWIGWKILLSPVTLLIDCVTWPFQETLFGDDDEQNHDHDDAPTKPQKRRQRS